MRWITRLAKLTSAAAVGAALVASTLAPSPAEARRHYYYRAWHTVSRHAYRPVYVHNRRPFYRPTSQPAVSAMVVDANTGKTLYANNEDQLRHPASITKVMTLFLLFEQLEKGRIRLDSEIPISAHAAAQPPTKLGLRAGSTIRVEDAIKAIVTESANDMAVAVAEAIGGSEDRFASLMTEKARELGMSRTFYRNASGLPNDEQLTTARDLIVLGRAIQDRFPREYAYFSTRVFYFQGRAHINHNHLLGRIEGMDGIKTGYTRASGFNLLASVRRDGRHILSVVLGGASAGSRDQIMANLIDRNIEVASATSRGRPTGEDRAPVEVAEATDDGTPISAVRMPSAEPAPQPRPAERTRIEPPARAMRAAAESPASATTPNRPRLAVVSGAPRATQPDLTGSIGSGAERKRIVLDGSTTLRAVAASAAASPSATPSALRWVAGPAPAPIRSATSRPAEIRIARLEPSEPAEQASPERSVAVSAVRSESIRSEAKPLTPAVPTLSQAAAHAGWIIQIGASDDLQKVNELLAKAKTQQHAALASARPFTEKVQKGDITVYRARFAGLESDQAETVCRLLKKSGFDCFTAKN